MSRAQLKRHLVLVAQVDGLHVLARTHVPEVQPVPVFAAEQQLGDDSVLDHRRGRPLRCHQHVVIDVPPDVVRQVLVASVLLELADDVKIRVVEQGHPAGAVLAVGAAQAGDVQVAGAAVHGVRAGVASPLAEFGRPEHLRDLGRRRVGLRVENIDAR